jgi:hypothetical protein
MANQPEATTYDAGVYQLEVVDPVDGGVGAVSNKPLLNLANRTAYLKQHMDNLESGATIPATFAPLNSAGLTGTPTAPTAALGDNSTKLATTAFVQGTYNGRTTKNVAGGANVTLTAVEAGTGILTLIGAITANIAVIVPSLAAQWIVENNTTGAFTVTVKTAAGTGLAVTQNQNVELFCDGTNVQASTSDFVSTAFTGSPTAPTPSVGDQSTRLATTNFAYQLKNGVTTVNVAGGSNVTLTAAQYGNGIILLTGAITASINVVVPAQGGTYVVANQTTGAFSINLSAGGAGAKALVPQGQSVVAYCDGTNVVLAGAAASSSFSLYTFTATAGQTVFSCPYTPGNILVLVNGATESPTDYTASNGSSVTLNVASALNDDVKIIAFASFTVANALPLAGGTMAGPITHAGGDTGVTPAPGDNSTKLATTAFILTALGSYAALAGSTSQVFNAANATAATHAVNRQFGDARYAALAGLSTQQFAVATATAGVNAVNLSQLKQFGFTGSTIVTAATNGTIPLTTLGGTELTTAVVSRALPAAVSAGNGGRIEICAFASGVTLVPQAGDSFTTISGTTPATLVMGLGETAVLESNGGLVWYLVGGSIALQYAASFLGAKAVNGYQKLPSGLTIQWGSGTTNTSGAVPVAFPLAFTNTAYQVVVGAQYAGLASVTFGWQNNSVSSFNVYSNVAAANNFSYFAIGV